MKIFFITFLFLNLFLASSLKSSVLFPGEFLEYNVTYLGISIANVKIYTDGNEMINKRNVTKVRANVFTYGHIPLINAKVKMEGWIDRGNVYSHKFIRNLTLRSNPWEYQKIEFDYIQNILKNRKWINDKSTSSIYLEFDPAYKIHDALGLFFKTRFAAKPGTSPKILTYLDESPFYTNIQYNAKKQYVSVSAVKGDVKSIYCTGSGDWQKQFGLTGKFEGWFSDDEAKIPLKGKLDFIIGNISIELVKYKREGWTPPR
jgi:hypothetical protein